MSNLAILDNYYEQYLQLEQQKKESFLNEMANQEPEIYSELLQLLHDDEVDDFFNEMEKEVAYSFRGKCYEPGSSIGNYRLDELIGAGGMSFVYRGSRTDGIFERNSAIKIVRKGLDSSKMIQCFRQECFILAKLHHENIAQIFDGGITTEGLPYFVMEYVDGLNIVEHCRQNNLTIAQRFSLFIQLCNAVEYCHQNGIIHCDLKPNNVLVTRSGQVKLTDFGIARFDSDQSITSTNNKCRALTVEYASPELINDGDIDKTSDIYQLGLILFEVLTFEKACNSNLNQSSWQDLKLPSKPLMQIVKLCVQPNPAMRFPEVNLLITAIDQVLESNNQMQNSAKWSQVVDRTLDKFLNYAAGISL